MSNPGGTKPSPIDLQPAAVAAKSVPTSFGLRFMLRVCTVFAIAVAGIAVISTDWSAWQFFVCLGMILGWCLLTCLALAAIFRWRDGGRAKLGKLLYRSRVGVYDQLPTWTGAPVSLRSAMIYATLRVPAAMAVLAFLIWCGFASYYTDVEFRNTADLTAALHDFFGVLAFLLFLWVIQIFSLFVAIARPIGLEFYSNGLRSHGIGGITWDMVTSAQWARYKPDCLQVKTEMPGGGGWIHELGIPADEQSAIDELLSAGLKERHRSLAPPPDTK